MMEKEHARFRQRQRPFSTDVAAILLATFGVMEATSLVGWSHTVTSSLPSPISTVMRMAILITAFLGVYGLVKDKKIGAHLAILALVFETTLGATSLMEALKTAPINAAVTVQFSASLILGLTAVICVFEAETRKQRDLKTVLDVASPSSTKKLRSSAHDYAVEVENVTKRYLLGPVVVPAINGLSMKIRRGEFVAIMGPSGSGKSTLLNLVGALDRPSSGRVLIDGVDISTLNDSSLAKLRNEKIGFVFQSYNLIARSSVLRNMELPALVKGYSRGERLKRIDNLLAIVGLNDKAPRKPMTLSGGEQQRVAIARALTNDPSIVLADEPTGNIDSKTGKEIIGFLRKMNVERKTTVIIVTHDREVAEVADRIIRLRDGKTLQDENMRSLPI